MDDVYIFLWLGFIVLLIGGGGLLFFLSKSQKFGHVVLPYVRTPLLSDSERRFFSVLLEVIPEDYYLLTQVRLANLVKVKQGSGGSFWKSFSPIGMKCVDFVIVQRDTVQPLLIVELDDSSHKLVHRQKRDHFIDSVLAYVDLPVLHYPTQQFYNKTDLTKAIKEKLRK